MRRIRPFLVALAALALAVPAGVSAQDEMVDVSGTSFTLFGAPVSVEGDAIEGFLAAYNGEKGTEIGYTGSDDFESQLRIQVEGGNPPEVAFTPQPGTPCAMAETGELASLESMGFDIAELEARHSKYWMDLVQCADGEHYGLPWFPNFKSIVYYHQPTFEEMGYEIPETYEDMVALSEQIVADGMTPWCFGFGSGGATGWPGTDWLEDIVLREDGTDYYQQWYKHEVPFNDPPVVAALDTFGEILFGDGFVLGGAENIENIDFRDSPGPLFSEPPGCLMLKQGSFITNYFATQPEYEDGEESEIGVFTFPTIDGNGGAMGGGDTILVFNPTPENIQIVTDWTSPDWLCTLASPGGGGVAPYGGHGVAGVERLPGDVGVDPACYESPAAKIFAQAVLDALASNTFVFDGGDLMPPAVGQGTLWTGMVDFSKGVSAQEVADTIEASWPEE
jgi:alpha-glucoside transport system substrate-binding protein